MIGSFRFITEQNTNHKNVTGILTTVCHMKWSKRYVRCPDNFPRHLVMLLE